jgi:hypothetical protein
MTSDASRPATDADRDRVRALLRDLMGQGRISLTDYQGRLRRVAAASTTGDLDAVVRDLPAPPEAEDGGTPGGPSRSAPPPATARPGPAGREPGGERGPSTATLQKIFLVVVALGVLAWAITYWAGR